MTRFDDTYEETLGLIRYADKLVLAHPPTMAAIKGLLEYVRLVDERLADITEYNRLGDGS